MTEARSSVSAENRVDCYVVAGVAQAFGTPPAELLVGSAMSQPAETLGEVPYGRASLRSVFTSVGLTHASRCHHDAGRQLFHIQLPTLFAVEARVFA